MHSVRGSSIYLAMEIKDPIHGAISVSSAEVAILDNPFFQRLRLIKQLGFSEFSFPGATHNRYIHSLGVCHIAGQAFDSIFRKYPFANPQVKKRLRQVLRLAALLHDVGHGPLSHATEEVMPRLSELQLPETLRYKSSARAPQADRQANHEDYTIKILTDSVLSEAIRENFSDVSPIHIACLIDKTLECPDDFFIDQGIDFRTILSQIVSSEIDVDRMDYLARDSYFCGVNYGVVEFSWILANLTYHTLHDELFLSLNRRALYTFDDFLLSRHHMYLMVYFHHKSIVYEEMLYRYLTSPDCQYLLPAQIEEYTRCTDYSLYEHLADIENIWAQRITHRHPYKVLFEMHITGESPRSNRMYEALTAEGIDVIRASSRARLSKYHSGSQIDKAFQIYVVDQYDMREKPIEIEKCTQIFQKYEETRSIERLYVHSKELERGRKIITERGL